MFIQKMTANTSRQTHSYTLGPKKLAIFFKQEICIFAHMSTTMLSSVWWKVCMRSDTLPMCTHISKLWKLFTVCSVMWLVLAWLDCGTCDICIYIIGIKYNGFMTSASLHFYEKKQKFHVTALSQHSTARWHACISMYINVWCCRCHYCNTKRAYTTN